MIGGRKFKFSKLDKVLFGTDFKFNTVILTYSNHIRLAPYGRLFFQIFKKFAIDLWNKKICKNNREQVVYDSNQLKSLY